MDTEEHEKALTRALLVMFLAQAIAAAHLWYTWGWSGGVTILLAGAILTAIVSTPRLLRFGRLGGCRD